MSHTRTLPSGHRCKADRLKTTTDKGHMMTTQTAHEIFFGEGIEFANKLRDGRPLPAIDETLVHGGDLVKHGGAR